MHKTEQTHYPQRTPYVSTSLRVDGQVDNPLRSAWKNSGNAVR